MPTGRRWLNPQTLYHATQHHLEKSTRENNGRVIVRFRDSWQGGSSQSLDQVRPSHVEGWLSAQGGERSASSLSSFIELVRAVHALAVWDRLLPSSSAAGIKYQMLRKPTHKTPAVEEFRVMEADIRAQVHNADSKDSADFVDFIGLAGSGRRRRVR